MADGMDGTTELTVDTAASLLEGLSLEDEDQEPDPAASDADDTAEDTDESPDEPTEDAPAEDDADPAAEDDEDPEPSDEEEPAPPAPKIFKVKVDGEEVEVPEEELVKGYSRTADYTRKTQLLAAERKRFEEEEVSQVRAERAQYATYLTELQKILATAAPSEPDWTKLRAEMEPADFAAAVADWTLTQERQKKVAEELEATRRKQDADERAQQVRFIQEEQRKLQDALPEWAVPETAAKEKQALRDYALELGYDADDLDHVADHRLIVMLRKAWLYDQASRKVQTVKAAKPKPAPAAPVKPAVAPVKPGPSAQATKKTTPRDAAQRRLRATGSDRDAAALIETMLD